MILTRPTVRTTTPPAMVRGLLLCSLALVSCPVLLAQDTDAAARYGSTSLESGFMPDPYTVEVMAGGSEDAAGLGADCVGRISFERPDFELTYVAGQYPLGLFVDTAVDTSLVVNTPEGNWLCNDDFAEASGTNPGLVFEAPVSGVYDIWVGAYDDAANNETARLMITENTAEPQWDSVAAADGGIGNHSGRLQKDDDTLSSGEYADTYYFDARSGEQTVIDLQSAEFDTYLLVVAPSGEQFDNDDHDGDQERSLLALTINETGSWRVVATSYAAGETGSYTLAITKGGGSPADLSERGRLEAGDTMLDSGEYYDAYEIEGVAGQQVSVSLESGDFDTYLIVRTPDGEALQNDDAGDGSDSHLDFTMNAGTYRVLVTSYATGEAGSYALAVRQDAAGTGPATSQDSVELDLGQSLAGRLQDGDAQLDNGEYRDLYTFAGNSGQNVRITLHSDEFDTYLALITPGGENIENDDVDGDTSQSVIELTLPEDGRYRIMATSYASGETGDYSLAVASSSERPAPSTNVARNGRIFGIFAGMADYPGEDNDLPFTDQDAQRTRDALINGAGMDPANAITLLNADATRDNLQTAISTLAGRMQPEDTFVFFYSGHGAQVQREGPQPADPDGYDETIELYDGAITDDAFNTMLGSIGGKHALIVLDSCFSGGFAKDLISVPGRMGLFSSEEDVTSQVAAKFRAGGYLSVFFEEALGGGYADADQSGDLTAIELSQYLHERFRNDVKSFGEDRFVNTTGSMMGYQHLVVDRGSIAPYDVLFSR